MDGERTRIALAVEREAEMPASPWDTADAFQFSGKRTLALPLLADGESVVAQVSFSATGPQVTVGGAAPAGDAFAVVAGNAAYVLRNGRQTKVTLRDLAIEEAGGEGQGGLVRAPMHGKVLAVLVAQGATVTRGQRVAIVEAMKMEHTLVAPIDGVVTEIAVAANAQVPEGARLMLIEAAAAATDRP
jgi:3-methylcrotonyl-CoA carboxylase alpha subunit